MQTFQSWPDAFLALQQKNIDAVATDNIVLAGMRAAAPNPDDYILVGREGVYSGGYLGIILRENDSKSRDAINYILQDQWNDGTWQKAFDKWLGKDSPLKLIHLASADVEVSVLSEGPAIRSWLRPPYSRPLRLSGMLPRPAGRRFRPSVFSSPSHPPGRSLSASCRGASPSHSSTSWPSSRSGWRPAFTRRI